MRTGRSPRPVPTVPETPHSAQFYRTTPVRPDFLALLDQWETQLRAGQTPTNLFEDPATRNAQFGDHPKAADQAEVLTRASQRAGVNANVT